MPQGFLEGNGAFAIYIQILVWFVKICSNGFDPDERLSSPKASQPTRKFGWKIKKRCCRTPCVSNIIFTPIFFSWAGVGLGS